MFIAQLCYICLSAVCGVLSRRTDWVLSGRHPSPPRRHEGPAADHFPRGASTAQSHVWQGEMNRYQDCFCLKLLLVLTETTCPFHLELQKMFGPVTGKQTPKMTNYSLNVNVVSSNSPAYTIKSSLLNPRTSKFQREPLGGNDVNGGYLLVFLASR